MQTFFLNKNAIRDLSKIVAFLSSLSKGRRWKLEISEDRCTRSVQQCRYLNGVAYKILGDRTGYERDDISEYLCSLYFGEREKRVPKTKRNTEGVDWVPLRTTTTDENGNRSVLTTSEFMDYVSFVQRFAAARGIHIPDPNEEFEDEAKAA